MKWGDESKKKGAKVGRKCIQQSTRAGGGNGRQWGGSPDGGLCGPMTTGDASLTSLINNNDLLKVLVLVMDNGFWRMQ